MALKYVQIIALAAVFLLQYALEHLYPEDRKINDWKGERFNIGIGAMNLALGLLPAAALVELLQFIEAGKIGLLQAGPLPLWAEIAAAFFILDLWMYAWHRLNHQVPLLWKFHRFHHRDEKMNSTTALRFHTAELLLSYPGKAAVCLLAGITYTPLIIYEIFFFSAVVVHHSNIRISERWDAVYRILFASPLMHRIHHSRRLEETHSNYGALFSFWDRIFRSWTAKPAGPIKFGVDEKESDGLSKKSK